MDNYDCGNVDLLAGAIVYPYPYSLYFSLTKAIIFVALWLLACAFVSELLTREKANG